MVFINSKVAFEVLFLEYHMSLMFRGALSSYAIGYAVEEHLCPV